MTAIIKFKNEVKTEEVKDVTNVSMDTDVGTVTVFRIGNHTVQYDLIDIEQVNIG